MNVSTTVPATIQIRRSRLLGLIGGAAAVAAAITWAVLAFAVDTGTETAKQSVAVPTVVSSPIPVTGYLEAIRPPARTVLTAQERRALSVVNSLTAAQLRGIRFYWTPGSTGPTAHQSVPAPTVVSSPIPATGYLEAIRSPATKGLTAQEQRALDLVTGLTHAQLKGVRYYWTPPRAGLTASEQRALDVVTALTPAQLKGIRYYWTPPAAS